MATTKTLTPAQSVYVNYNYTDNNYADETCLRVGVGSSTSRQTQTLLQFPLDEIPGGVSKATLRLYSYSDECWNASVTQLVRANVEAWEADSVTWNTKPDTTEENQASSTVSGYDKWYEWDVTELVKAQKTGNNFGFTVLQSGTTTQKAKCFKKSGTTAPQLVVEFNPMTFTKDGVGGAVSNIVFNGQPVTSLVLNGNAVF